MQEVYKYLKDYPVFFLATVEEDQPRVRPFGAVAEFEGKLYLTTNNQKPVFEQIKTNPKVEICGSDNQGGWLRVEAKAVPDSRKKAREKMLEENPMLKDMYSADDGKMEVFYLEEATATFASMTDAPRTVKF